MNRIIDPTKPSTGNRGGAPAGLPRRRVADLSGTRVALVENTKRNAAELLDAIGERLDAERSVELSRYTKQVFAQPISEDVLGELERSSDVVLVGVGDCGSCSAAAIADGLALERRGIPTAVLVTEAFEPTARAMADMLGAGDFDFLVMPHPIANLTSQEILDRAEALLGPVRERLESSAHLATS